MSPDIHHRELDTSLGRLTLVGEGETVTGIYFPGHWTRPDRAGFGPDDPDAFGQASRELIEYLAGGRRTFTFAYGSSTSSASPLRRAVWEQIAAIPYGETRSYAELSAATGSHPRAVGNAVGHNPLSIVVPCHRVVGSGGSLTGYAGGLERKRALLELEGARPAQSTLALDPPGPRGASACAGGLFPLNHRRI